MYVNHVREAVLQMYAIVMTVFGKRTVHLNAPRKALIRQMRFREADLGKASLACVLV